MWQIINKHRSTIAGNGKASGDLHDLIWSIPSTNIDPLFYMGSLAEIPVISFSEVTYNEIREVINNLNNKNCWNAFGLNVRIIRI